MLKSKYCKEEGVHNVKQKIFMEQIK